MNHWGPSAGSWSLRPLVDHRSCFTWLWTKWTLVLYFPSQHHAPSFCCSAVHTQPSGAPPPGSMDLLKVTRGEASPSPCRAPTGHHDAGRFHPPSLLPQATWADHGHQADGPRSGEMKRCRQAPPVGGQGGSMRGSAVASPPPSHCGRGLTGSLPSRPAAWSCQHHLCTQLLGAPLTGERSGLNLTLSPKYTRD